jgi:hypothetical protein
MRPVFSGRIGQIPCVDVRVNLNGVALRPAICRRVHPAIASHSVTIACSGY